jgi:hypothetical protein
LAPLVAAGTIALAFAPRPGLASDSDSESESESEAGSESDSEESESESESESDEPAFAGVLLVTWAALDFSSVESSSLSEESDELEAAFLVAAAAAGCGETKVGQRKFKTGSMHYCKDSSNTYCYTVCLLPFRIGSRRRHCCFGPFGLGVCVAIARFARITRVARATLSLLGSLYIPEKALVSKNCLSSQNQLPTAAPFIFFTSGFVTSSSSDDASESEESEEELSFATTGVFHRHQSQSKKYIKSTHAPSHWSFSYPKHHS